MLGGQNQVISPEAKNITRANKTNKSKHENNSDTRHTWQGEDTDLDTQGKVGWQETGETNQGGTDSDCEKEQGGGDKQDRHKRRRQKKNSESEKHHTKQLKKLKPITTEI